MSEQQTTIVTCQKCGHVLDEPSDTPLHDRAPCPICGSTARHVKVEITSTVNVQAGLRAKGRTGQPGQPGSKPWLTTMSEPSWSYDRKKWMHREKTEDRRNDRYTETVTDPDTGEIIHHTDEPLTEHRGRGSAKKKKDT